MSKYEFVTKASRLSHIANEIERTDAIALDIETTSLSPRDGEIRLVQLNTRQGVYVIDLWQTKTLEPVLKAISSEKVIKIIQGAKFEQAWFYYKYQIELWPIFDTHRASQLLYNGHIGWRHDLYSIYERELDVFHEIEDQGGSNWGDLNLTQDQKDYAAEDVLYLHQLRDVMKPKLRKAGLNQIALVEFGVVLPETIVELNGIYLDADMWTAVEAENRKNLEIVSRKLLDMLPDPEDQLLLPGMPAQWNLRSQKLLLKSLQRMGLKAPRRFKDEKGVWQEVTELIHSTDENSLAMIADKYPVINYIFDMREYATGCGTFGLEYLHHINPKTSRVHSSYWAFLLSGRYGSRKPNLAQVPRSKKYRSCFRAEPGNVIISADYSNIEMRVAAEISADPLLTQVFLENRDAHYQTASIITEKPIAKVSSEERQMSKCFHPDTEVLTRTGWKKIDDLVSDEEVVQAIPLENKIVKLEWVVPLEVFRMPNKCGKLINLRNEGVDLQVTPDHRMLVYRRNGKHDVVDPESMHKVRYWVNAGHMDTGLAVTASDLRCAMAVQADGTIRSSGEICFEFTKKRKIKRFREIFSHFNYKESLYKNGMTSFSVKPEESRRLRALLDGKKFPWWWLNLTRELREVVLDEIIYWDSCKMSNWKMTRFSSSIVQNVDVLQALASITGRKTRLTGPFKRCFVLSIKRQATTRGGNLEPKEVPYSDHVSCLSVPSSFVLVRNGGVPIVTGQSVNFGLLFGMGPDKLIIYAKKNYGVTMSRKQSFTFHKKYFDAYSGLRQWHRKALSAAKKGDLYARSIGGRIRLIESEMAYSEFLNSPVQSTAADGLKASLRAVYMRLKKFGSDVKMIHHVHDEIILEAKDDEGLIREVKKELEEGMMEGMQQFIKTIPVLVEPAHGPSWGDAH